MSIFSKSIFLAIFLAIPITSLKAAENTFKTRADVDKFIKSIELKPGKTSIRTVP